MPLFCRGPMCFEGKLENVPTSTNMHSHTFLSILQYAVKPRLHSRGFRAGCTRLDDPCTTGSTTLPRPGTSVPGRERPWGTAWRFSTSPEFFSWGKIQSRFFLSGAQTCLFVSWRPWLWHKRDKASYNRDRAGEKSDRFWGRLSWDCGRLS